MRPLPRLIIAEDDPEDLMILMRVLEKHQLLTRVSVVGDGNELLAYLRRHGLPEAESRRFPTVVLLDLQMPVMDGRDALLAIKGSELFKHVPILILTTFGSDSEVDHCYDRGANAFIQKPETLEGYDHVIGVVRNFWMQTAMVPYA